MSLPPEYFEATRQNYTAIVAAAKEALAAGNVIQPHRGKNGFLTGWSTLPDKPPLDPDSVFKSANGERFNLGAVISPDPQGDAPSIVVDVDRHGAKDQKDYDDCMAAKKPLLGDMPPTTITGSGGEHYHLRAPADFVALIFVPGNVIILDYEGKAEGKPYRRPPGEPKPRWAIEVFGPGHGITLPPSIHPDTLKPYRYGCDFPRTRPAPDLLIAAMRAERIEPGLRQWLPRGDLGAAKLPPVVSLDPRLVPEPFRGWAVDEAGRMPCSLEFFVVAAVVIAASIVGASCGLHPKRNDSWIVAVILWGMLIGPPGDMKSPAMNAAARPLLVLTKEARAKYETEMAAYAVEKRRYDALMAALDERMKKVAKSNGDTAGVALEIADLESRAPKEPIHRRYETNDVTVEKLVALLCNNHRGIMQRLDELTRLLFGFERPEHAGDRGTYLEGYEAFSPRSVDRIKRGELYVPRNCITLLGCIPPDAFAAWADMATDISRNDGFLPRFGMMVYPDPASWEWINRKPVPGAYERVELIFKKLADFDPVKWGAIQQEDDKVPGFRFSLAAQEVFIQWLTELRTVRIPAENDQFVRQHLSKYDRVFCSLSLIFHLIDRANYEIRCGGGLDEDGNVLYGADDDVSEDCARRAAAWMEFLESHMRRCYALIGHYRIRNANALATRIVRGDLKDGFTQRDVIKRDWSGLKGEKEVKSALEWLEAENWIRRAPRTAGKGGRPTDHYEIHPEIVADQKESARG